MQFCLLQYTCCTFFKVLVTFLTVFFQGTEKKDHLQDMLDTYVQEEQLTGNNQWRLVHSVTS